MLTDGGEFFNWKAGGGRQYWIPCIHIKNYSTFKDFIHPNIKHNIDHYKKGYYILPTYHGCGFRNKNGIRKRIDYKRGYQCILPTQNPFRRRAKKKYKQFYFYNTRYNTNYHLGALAFIKGNYYHNYKTKKYHHWKEVSKRVDFWWLVLAYTKKILVNFWNMFIQIYYQILKALR